MRELVNVWRAGTGILMVTHSVRVAAMSERVLYLMDGTVQGEIQLGRLEEDADTAGREQRLSAWLMERGW
jgi:putative ABC transport system ATP-binding protein